MNDTTLKKILFNGLLLALLAGISSVGLYLFSDYWSTNQHIEEANESYREGEIAETVGQRKEAFNRALRLYLQLENHYQPLFSNGKLYFYIANTYFQLSEYPLAILYYYRAQALRPHDKQITHNLLLALKKLNITPQENDSTLNRLFFFHSILPLPTKFQLFFTSSLIALLLYSLHFWRWIVRWKKGFALSLSVALVMVSSLLYTYLFESPGAVIVKSTGIYRGAGTQFKQVSDNPLIAGSLVEVLEREPNGKWLKIESDGKTIGFVPSTTLRII